MLSEETTLGILPAQQTPTVIQFVDMGELSAYDILFLSVFKGEFRGVCELYNASDLIIKSPSPPP